MTRDPSITAVEQVAGILDAVPQIDRSSSHLIAIPYTLLAAAIREAREAVDEVQRLEDECDQKEDEIDGLWSDITQLNEEISRLEDL